MFCEKCGTEIPGNAKFCEKCGALVEPDITKETSNKKWIFGGIAGGILLVVIIVAVLFATGVFGSEKDSTQVSTKLPPGMGVSETAIPSEEPTIIPTAEPTTAPEPTEAPAANAGGDEPEEAIEEDSTEDSYTDEDLTAVRTPEETYRQYIEAFVGAVNTGDTGRLSQVLSGKVYKQQCDLVENYYKRGIREELQSCSVTSIKQVNDNRTKVNAEETIKVSYEDGSSKVVKQKYSYVCECIDGMWMITNMKEVN